METSAESSVAWCFSCIVAKDLNPMQWQGGIIIKHTTLWCAQDSRKGPFHLISTPPYGWGPWEFKPLKKEDQSADT